MQILTWLNGTITVRRWWLIAGAVFLLWGWVA